MITISYNYCSLSLLPNRKTTLLRRQRIAACTIFTEASLPGGQRPGACLCGVGWTQLSCACW